MFFFQARRFILAAGFLICWVNATAQRYNFATYSISDGLPNNQINKILQDRSGKLWVATMNGACWFDGKNFTKFDQDNILSNNVVKTIFEDKEGNIWLGTVRKGLCRFDGSNTKFFTTDDGLLSDIVNAVCQDNQGNIWIGTSEGLNKFDGKTFTSYTTVKGLVNNNVFSLFTDHRGRIWITTIGGVSCLDGTAFINYTTENGLVSNIAYCCTETGTGDIWIGTYEGVSVFDGKTFHNYTVKNGLMNDRVQDIIKDYNGNMWMATNGGGVAKVDDRGFITLTSNQGLANNSVFSIIEDREGNYWFGTYNGLCKYNGDRFVTYTVEDGLSTNNIQTIFSDSEFVWAGSLNGGLDRYDGIGFQHFSTENGLRSNTVWTIYKDKKGKLWFGTTNGVSVYDSLLAQFISPLYELNNLIIYSILEDKYGRMYFATDKGVYIYFNNDFTIINSSNGLENDKVRVLFEDKKGVMWVGTNKGIYYLKGQQAISFNDFYNIPKVPVTSICADTSGNMLISTFDFGLIRYDRESKTNPVTFLNKESGLFNDRVLFSFLDYNHNLWLGSPEGIDWIDWQGYLRTGKLNVVHYDKSNGYLGVESNAACADRDSNIWFGTVNGAIKYNSGSGNGRTSVPVVSITNLQLFLSNVDWKKRKIEVNNHTGLPENLVLAYNNNHLSFAFSGIYLTAPNEVRYRFILEGFDEDWSPVSLLNIANYSNISPGKYTFKVKATANGRNWSNPVTYTFEIKPPFWRTPIFYFIYVIAISGSLFLFIKSRTAGLRRTRDYLQGKVELRTRELKIKNQELAKLSLVASETDNAVLIFNDHFELEWVNEGFTKMTGFKQDEFIKQRGSNLSNITMNKRINEILKECVEEKKSFIYEALMQSKTGQEIWTSSTLTPIFNEAGKLKNVVIIDTDITYRKRMEEQITASLEEKGLLLREIHHRVKNNLQIIISLFNLQSSYIGDDKALKALKEGQDRVKSMALIHERFYQSDGLSKIDFDEYIKRLAENLFLSYGTDPEKIKLIIEAEKVSLDIDTAVPCGLIINELVSNALKHAFRPGDSGEIKVIFMNPDEQSHRLIISDNGKGLSPDTDISSPETLGMQLVSALTDQLEGTVTVDKTDGTRFTIDFKKIIHK